MARFSWWHGIGLAPVVPLSKLVADAGFGRFVRAATVAGEPDAGVVTASFLLTVTAFWVGVLSAVAVFVCLLGDIRARSDAERSPSWAWGVAGVAHLVGTVVPGALVVSVPALSYYLYRRHERLGAP